MNNENRHGIEEMGNEQLDAYLKKGIDADELGKAVTENDAREMLGNAYNEEIPREYDIDRRELRKIEDCVSNDLSMGIRPDLEHIKYGHSF